MPKRIYYGAIVLARQSESDTIQASDADAIPITSETVDAPTDESTEVASADESPVRKRHTVRTILLLSSAMVLLLGGSYFGVRYFQEEKKTEDIRNLWTDVQHLADETPLESDITFESTSGNKDANKSESKSESKSDDKHNDSDFVDDTPVDPLDRVLNWSALQSVNSDIDAWIYLPNTPIDYPIMQEREFNSYFYLNHDVYSNPREAGSIFTPCEPDWFYGEDAHLLVFGHNMSNGTMFSSLMKYENESFGKSHPFIYIYRPDRVEKWAVWSVGYTDKTGIIYNMPYEYGSDNYSNLLKYMKDSSLYQLDIDEPSASDRVMTLSTCDNSILATDGRLIVNAVLQSTKLLGKE